MLSTAVFYLALAGLSSAQETISLFIPDADQMPLVASVIASDSAATTYAVQCAPGTDSNDCGLADGIILTQGPSTAAYTMSEGFSSDGTSQLLFTGIVDCSLAGTVSAVCVESFGGEAANFPGVSTETLTGTDFQFMEATLTTSSLTILATPANTGSSATPTNTSGSKTSGASNTSSGSSKTSSGTSATSGTVQATSTKTGGMAMITGKAQWIVGGAAVAAALM